MHFENRLSFHILRTLWAYVVRIFFFCLHFFLHSLHFVRVHYVCAIAVVLYVLAIVYLMSKDSDFDPEEVSWVRLPQEKKDTPPWKTLICLAYIVLIILIIPLLFLEAEIEAWVERREYCRREKAAAAERLIEHQAELERREKNRVLAEKRREWFVENPPVLYYSTIEGVTGVMTPSMYERSRTATANAIMDEHWSKTNVMQPTADIYLFFTKSAKEKINPLLSERLRRCADQVAGQPSQLHTAVKSLGVILTERKDIFLPWVNEAVLPYNQHNCFTPQNAGYFNLAKLIEEQAPLELRSV